MSCVTTWPNCVQPQREATKDLEKKRVTFNENRIGWVTFKLSQGELSHVVLAVQREMTQYVTTYRIHPLYTHEYQSHG